MSIGMKLGTGAMLLLALMGCGKGQESADFAAASAPATEAPSSMAIDAEAGVPLNGKAAGTAGGTSARAQTVSYAAQRSIIRRADVAVRVDNVEKAEKEVTKMVSGIGGYVDSASSSDLASDHPSISLTLRVPVAQFDRALEGFEGLGVRLAKTVSSEDVTAQIVDLDARMKTLTATEETYRGLLKETRQLQHIIDLQDKLTQVRSEIESMASQRKTLGGLASLSTITLRLEQSAMPAQAPKDPNWLAQVWGESTTKLGEMMRVLASFAVWAVVFSPIWVPVLLLLRRAYRGNRAGAPAAVPPVQPR